MKICRPPNSFGCAVSVNRNAVRRNLHCSDSVYGMCASRRGADRFVSTYRNLVAIARQVTLLDSLAAAE
tara:strand:+ start:102 stop:308 length:207 start_codon:yes stop_codon:yes gene_type:complete